MNYFEEKTNKNYAIDLFTDVDYEFSNKEGKLPTESQFEQFVFQHKKELIESINRLTSIERALFFDKLKKEYSGEYPGLRKYYLEHIEIDSVLLNKEFPEIEFNKDVSLEIVEKIEKRYSLYPFFESAKNQLLIFINQLETQGLTVPEIKTKLKVPQIALIHVYEGKQITRENAPEIAAKHGYKAKNSGEGLFQDYTFYCSTANRKGKPTPCTPKKLKNKIELFESVVNYLSDSNKQRAIDEIKILKTLFDNEY